MHMADAVSLLIVSIDRSLVHETADAVEEGGDVITRSERGLSLPLTTDRLPVSELAR